MPLPPLRAVVLDMDGVLINSEPQWQRAEMDVFARVGLQLTPEMTLRTMGLRIDEVARYWLTQRPELSYDPGPVAEQVLERVVELVRTQGVPMPGVAACLDAVDAAGLRLGLASSSPARLITAVLERLGIANRFAVTHSAEEEAAGKPDPAVYLSAARKLGVEPTACLAVEDSINGVRAAKAAGMFCVAVPDPTVRTDPRFSQADLVVPSLVDVAALVRGISGP